MLQIGINGYGTIGKRVADAVAAQPDMRVGGVAKRSPSFEASMAVNGDRRLYAAADAEPFRAAGIDVAGTVEELVDESDVIVDATPSGVGAENRSLYRSHGTPAVFQGGEPADVADASFNASALDRAPSDATSLRVVSCNTTALARLLAPLREAYGVEKARVTLIRRGGDPDQPSRGPINDVVPDPVSLPSHHGPDVQTLFPDLAIDTLAVKVPATLMHLHGVNVTLDSPATAEAVRRLLHEEPRIQLVPAGLSVDGCASIKEIARDAGRPRGDVWENCVWSESITVEGRDLYCFQAVHQESDVVPENVDAIRALAGSMDLAESAARTDEALGIGDLQVSPVGRQTRSAV